MVFYTKQLYMSNQCICTLYFLFACFTLHLFSELYAQDFLNRLWNVLVPYACFSGERPFISPHLYFVFNFSCISMLCIKWFPLKHNLCSKVRFLWLNFRLLGFSTLPGVWVPSITSRESSPRGNSFDLCQMPSLDKNDSLCHGRAYISLLWF